MSTVPDHIIPGLPLQTYTGKMVDPLHVRVQDIDILDIAHALSQICRYGGHTMRHYSVAEHSVLVSHNVPEELALQGLLHDATEAYVGDMIFPLKRSGHFEKYRGIEDEIALVIASVFNLPSELDPIVKDVDFRMVADERRALMRSSIDDAPWPAITDVKPLGIRPAGLAADAAKRVFLERFSELTLGEWSCQRCDDAGVSCIGIKAHCTIGGQHCWLTSTGCATDRKHPLVCCYCSRSLVEVRGQGRNHL